MIEDVQCFIQERTFNCGYIVHRDFIITFGGASHGECFDSIYMLNRRQKEKGWTESRLEGVHTEQY